MSDFFLKSGAGAIPYSNRAWSLGEKMVPVSGDSTTNASIAKAAVWEVTTAGTSTATPTWPASVTYDTTTVTQNGVVWKARKPGYSSGSTVDWSFATIYLSHLAFAMNLEGTTARGLVSNNHAESISTNAWTATFPGTVSAPSQILCVNDNVTSGFTLATTATVTTTGANGMGINGSFLTYGISFACGTGATGGNLTLSNTGSAWQRYLNCAFSVPASAGNLIVLGGASSSGSASIEWDNCNYNAGVAGCRINLSRSRFRWRGGAATFTTTSPTAIFAATSNAFPFVALVEDCDFSALNSAMNWLATQAVGAGALHVRRCRTPWSADSGNIYVAAPTEAGTHVQLDDVSSVGATAQRQSQNAWGTITNVDIARSGSDATSAWKLSASAIASSINGLQSEVSAEPNSVTGSGITATLEIIADAAAALDNSQVHLRASYYGSAAHTQGGIATTAPGVLDTPTALTTSSAAWDASPTMASRTNSAAYALHSIFKIASNPGRLFFCTVAGTAAGSEPGGYATAADGDTIVDGTATFRAGRRYSITTPSFTPQLAGPVWWSAVVSAASLDVYVDRVVTLQ